MIRWLDRWSEPLLHRNAYVVAIKLRQQAIGVGKGRAHAEPPEDADDSTRLSLLERHVSQAVRHLLPASQSASRHERPELAPWQRRSWEHQIRDDPDDARHVDYIHYHPVKHGLVAEVRDWTYSTFHRYVRLGPPDWAGAALPRTEGGYGEPTE